MSLKLSQPHKEFDSNKEKKSLDQQIAFYVKIFWNNHKVKPTEDSLRDDLLHFEGEADRLDRNYVPQILAISYILRTHF